MNTIFITGISSGIGRHLVFEFLQKLRQELFVKFGMSLKVEISSLYVTEYKNIFTVVKDFNNSMRNSWILY